GSAQIVELRAAVKVFCLFPNSPFNLIADSAYVTRIFLRMPEVSLHFVNTADITLLLVDLISPICSRRTTFFVMHIHSHANLPGPLMEGCAHADRLMVAVISNQTFTAASEFHASFHQNAAALSKDYGISMSQAHVIVNVRLDCHCFSSPRVPGGVIRRGLAACQLLQTDVTHVLSFGWQKFVHCSVDSFSGFLVATYTTAHTGESAKDIHRHLLHSFATMGWPEEIHTSNGPAYQSNSVAMFLQAWGVPHSFGIVHNPSSQGVVQQMDHTLKNLLAKQKRG
ncbi:POK8 protein, partial [Malurus elegans]|nr:POK8 protein [Malurus elegans]